MAILLNLVNKLSIFFPSRQYLCVDSTIYVAAYLGLPLNTQYVVPSVGYIDSDCLEHFCDAASSPSRFTEALFIYFLIHLPQ